MHWTERLSEYVDGELSAAERSACEAHLAACEACRGALEEVRTVMSVAQADADVMPSNDLWPGILDRIAAPAPGAVPFARPVRRANLISFTFPQLALAASLLIAVSSTVAYLAAGRALTPRPAPAAETPIQAVAEPVLPPSADLTPANFADAQFDRAVSDLEQILAEQRGQLDPRTVVVIERNLATIDQAIRDARTALQSDPANPFLNSHLADARRRKLDLLRHATMLNSAGD